MDDRQKIKSSNMSLKKKKKYLILLSHFCLAHFQQTSAVLTNQLTRQVFFFSQTQMITTNRCSNKKSELLRAFHCLRKEGFFLLLKRSKNCQENDRG